MSLLSRFYKKKESEAPQLRTLNRVATESGVRAAPFVFSKPIVADELPLDVVLHGQATLERVRMQTRVPKSSVCSHLLNNWLSFDGAIDAHAALSLGFAAHELGVRTLNVRAPEGRFAMEELRLLRASANRFDLKLALQIRDDEHGIAVAHWADLIELQPKTPQISISLLKTLSEMGKAFVVKRSSQLRLKVFLELISQVRRDFTGELLIVESPKRDEAGSFGFDSIHLQRLMEQGSSKVLLDLHDAELSGKDRQSLALAAIGSSISGIVLPLELTTALSESFQELNVTLQKLNALRYTLDALNHIR